MLLVADVNAATLLSCELLLLLLLLLLMLLLLDALLLFINRLFNEMSCLCFNALDRFELSELLFFSWFVAFELVDCCCWLMFNMSDKLALF